MIKGGDEDGDNRDPHVMEAAHSLVNDVIERAREEVMKRKVGREFSKSTINETLLTSVNICFCLFFCRASLNQRVLVSDTNVCCAILFLLTSAYNFHNNSNKIAASRKIIEIPTV